MGKDPGSSQNSYKLFWKSYGYHHNRCENQPGTFKVLMDYIGNLQVTSKIGMRKTPGTTTVLIGYIGNLMVGGTTDTKISLEYSKLLWIILENLQVTSKIGTTKNSYRLFWQSYGWRHNRYENKLATDSKMYRNSIGGANIV